MMIQTTTATTTVSGTLTVQHAELGLCQQVPVKDLGRATPGLLLQLLERCGAIPAATAERPYLVLANGRTLALTEPFAAQGVVDGSLVTLVSRGTGAATEGRRSLDYETFAASFSPASGVVKGWTAYRSMADAHCGRPTTKGHMASVYEVGLNLNVPIDAERWHSEWRVRLDASGGTYPDKAPEAMVLGSPVPWNPHVRPDGWVCVGTLWRPEKLLAFFVLDLLRVLNFDFGIPAESYDSHYSPRAVKWWRKRGGGPLHWGSVYPAVLTPEALAQVRHADPLDALFGPLT